MVYDTLVEFNEVILSSAAKSTDITIFTHLIEAVRA